VMENRDFRIHRCCCNSCGDKWHQKI
jgi:hypothetical protein